MNCELHNLPVFPLAALCKAGAKVRIFVLGEQKLPRKFPKHGGAKRTVQRPQKKIVFFTLRILRNNGKLSFVIKREEAFLREQRTQILLGIENAVVLPDAVVCAGSNAALAILRAFTKRETVSR